MAHPPPSPGAGDGRKGGVFVIAAMSRSAGRLGDMPRTVLIVLFDGVQSLDVTGPLEVFANAGTRGKRATRSRPRASAAARSARRAADHHPRRRPARAQPATARPAARPRRPGRPPRRPGPGAAGWPRHAREAERIASVCTGAFLLAEAGLLRRQARHHPLGVQRRAGRPVPGLTVDPDPIFIKDGNVATSAGVTAGIDLALALVEDDLGRDVALALARHLVVFLRRPGSQSQFSAQLSAQVADRAAAARGAAVDRRAPRRRPVRRRPRRAGPACPRASSPAPSPPRSACRPAATSTGRGSRPPAAASRTPPDGVEETARACGYGTSEAMRRAFVRALGVSPAEYRRRFRPEGAPCRSSSPSMTASPPSTRWARTRCWLTSRAPR